MHKQLEMYIAVNVQVFLLLLVFPTIIIQKMFHLFSLSQTLIFLRHLPVVSWQIHLPVLSWLFFRSSSVADRENKWKLACLSDEWSGWKNNVLLLNTCFIRRNHWFVILIKLLLVWDINCCAANALIHEIDQCNFADKSFTTCKSDWA